MNRLALRLALVFLGVTLLPLAGFGFLVVGLMERSLTDQVRANHLQLAEAARGSLRLYMDTARGKLRSISAILGEQASGKQAKVSADRLNGLLEPPDIFVELRVYGVGKGLEELAQAKQSVYSAQQMDFQNFNTNRAGQQMASNKYSQEWERTLDVNHPLVKLSQAGNDVFAPTLQKIDNLSTLSMAVPMEGREATILVGNLDFTPVWKQFETIAGERQILVVDSVNNGLIDTRPLSGEVLEARLPAGHADWTIVVREERAAALAPLKAARWQAIGWIGGGAAVAIGLSFAVAAFILRPVKALGAAADRLKSGDLSARSGVTRDDELGLLARSFDQMAAALQELDQVKSDFVSHVSHELRTPLTSMKLSVANLLDGVVGPLDSRQQEVLARIRLDLDRLIRMVNELLDIARLEAGRVELSRESLDLADVVRGAVESLRPLAERRGVRLAVTSEPSAMTGDRAKLHEVALNLIDNAIKFTPQGGQVEVVVSPRRLVVRDTGCGIAADRLPRIFDKFATVHARPGLPGAGLGLSITRKLVELHGGSIAVESALESGSTFTVSF